MKRLVLCCSVVLAACGTSDEQTYDDVLPLTGATASAPNIMSATGFCIFDAGPNTHYIRVLVTASDSLGDANLDVCGLKVGEVSESAPFDANGMATVQLERFCMPDSRQALSISVRNMNPANNPGATDDRVTIAYLTLSLAAP